MHTTKSPLAGATVSVTFSAPHFQMPSDKQTIEFAVEDWWDRLGGESWKDTHNFATSVYGSRIVADPLSRVPVDDEVLYGHDKATGLGHLVHVSEVEGYEPEVHGPVEDVKAPVVEVTVTVDALVRGSIADKDEEGSTVVKITDGISVIVKAAADKDLFVRFVKEWADGEHGEFCQVTLDDLAGGVSYIHLGGWLGSQTVAFMFLALGVHHGAWGILSAETLGADRETAAALTGLGFIFNDGISEEFLALVTA